MKYLQIFEGLTKDFAGLRGEHILYHGCHSPHDFAQSDDYPYFFLSTEEDFTSRYGQYLYKVRVCFNNTFDSLNDRHMRLLFNQWNISLRGDFSGDNISNLRQWKGSDENTWEYIESALDDIVNYSHCDSILITEQRVENYIIFDPASVSLEIVEMTKR